MRPILSRVAVLVLGGCLPCLASAPEGWSSHSPRLEIQPTFTFLPEGGPDHHGSFVIEADDREGLFGWWEKTFPVHGGSYYEFSARRKVEHVATPRRTAVARVLWRDEKGRPVLHDQPSWASYQAGRAPAGRAGVSRRPRDRRAWLDRGQRGLPGPVGGHAGHRRAHL